MARRLPLLALLALPLLAGPAHATHAWDPPALLGLEAGAGDRDHDGHPEASARSWAPEGAACGCACPFAGAEAAAEAFRQRVVVGAASVVPAVCGVGAWADLDPAEPAPGPGPGLRLQPILGLPPLGP